MLSKNNRNEPLMPELHDKPAKTKYAVEAYDLKLLSGYMRQLSETCQQLLHLFYFNEMDTKNIAVVMNFANADTVKAKKYQCFKKLQELIKNELSRGDFYE
jgi:DNA-directed RNA polymerase specialized sigma subunit